MKLKIYVSGAWSRKSELKVFAERLKRVGMEVTSRWLDIDASSLEEAAIIDAADIKRCDLVLRWSDSEYTDDSKKDVPRRLLSGARHTEVGMALAWNKQVAVIGGHQNAFDYLEQVLHFATFEDFVEWLHVWHDATDYRAAA